MIKSTNLSLIVIFNNFEGNEKSVLKYFQINIKFKYGFLSKDKVFKRKHYIFVFTNLYNINLGKLSQHPCA